MHGYLYIIAKSAMAVRSRLFVERPRPTDPSVGFCRIPTRSGPTDRPTAARSAAKIRVGPIDRPTRPRAARRKIDGRDRPTDRPCRAQRGAKFTVGTDRPTDPTQLRGKLHHDGQNDAMVNGRTGNCNGTVFQTQSMRCNQGYGNVVTSGTRHRVRSLEGCSEEDRARVA